MEEQTECAWEWINLRNIRNENMCTRRGPKYCNKSIFMEYKDYNKKKILTSKIEFIMTFLPSFKVRFLCKPQFSKAIDYRIKIAQQAANSYRIKYK